MVLFCPSIISRKIIECASFLEAINGVMSDWLYLHVGSVPGNHLCDVRLAVCSIQHAPTAYSMEINDD